MASRDNGGIVLDSVCVEFESEGRTITALRNIDLNVRTNEFVCIMGPSGCGKTTLLNLIAGFLRPTRGKITVSGEVVKGPGADRAVVFQEDAVFPWMTVADNIGFSRVAQRRSKAETRAVSDRYMRLVHLEEFRDAWPKELSGGMKKRVDLARAYAADPDVLLLDEPFGTLDILTKEHLQVALHRLWRTDPRTVVFITHDLEEALFLGQRVVVMTPRPGRIADIYEPAFPDERAPGLKLSEEFIDLRRRIRERMEAIGIVGNE